MGSAHWFAEGVEGDNDEEEHEGEVGEIVDNALDDGHVHEVADVLKP